MIKSEVRKLINMHLAIARETPSASQHAEQLNIAKGMIGYAYANGDITAQEHSAEWDMIKLCREQHIQDRAKGDIGHA